VAKTPVLGVGPIRFTDANGAFALLPLVDFWYDAAGAPHGSGAVYTSNTAALDALLKELTADGTLQPDVTPAPNAAIMITAQQAGSSGNDISLTFANIRPDPSTPGNTLYDATAQEVDTYNLKLSALETTLGTSAGSGSSPGLVYISVAGGGSPTLPAAGPAHPLQSSGGGPYQYDIPASGSGGGTAFTVVARGGPSDGGQYISVQILNVDPTGSTFTMVVTFKKLVTVAAPADVNDGTKGLGYLVAAADSAGGSLGIPVAGTTRLLGGADAAGAAAAVKAAALVGAVR
jgi:hypothetical protein